MRPLHLLALAAIIGGGLACGSGTPQASATPPAVAKPAPKVAPVVPKPQIAVLLDVPGAKVVRVTLAVGGVLHEHTTPVHATVASMSGVGEVTIGASGAGTPPARHALGEHGAVFLPKEIPHGVINTGKTPLVLLVHHLKTTK